MLKKKSFGTIGEQRNKRESSGQLLRWCCCIYENHSLRNDALCVKVMDVGDSTLSIGDELYVSVRDGYDNYPVGCAVEVAYSGNVTVYDDGTSGLDRIISVRRMQ